MGLGEAVRSTYKNYANFLGTTSRSEYWLFILYTLMVTAVLSLIALAIIIFGSLGAVLLGANQGSSAAVGGVSASLIFLFIVVGIFGFWLLASIIPYVSSTVRRVRDAGLSGLFVLVIFIPAVGNIILFILTLLPSRTKPLIESVGQTVTSSNNSQDIW
jgi:uncharacterized membrane protein YhaH (DUF805 family)